MTMAPIHTVRATLAACVFVVLTAADTVPRAAQERGQGSTQGQVQAPRNLQVLAQSTSPETVLEVMRSFTEALGVQCEYCHVQSASPSGRGRGRIAPAFDFASDGRPQKEVTRAMMRMVGDLRSTIASATGKVSETATQVECITCHRGVAIPLPLGDVLGRVSREKGLADATAVYKDLRKRHFGAQAYDFSEGSLISYAQRAIRDGKPDEAIVWLELNLDYFPRSSGTYVALSDAHRDKNAMEDAVRSLERAVELDPENAQLRRQLEELRANDGGRRER